MRRGALLALSLLLFGAVALAARGLVPPGVSTVAWHEPGEHFGGWSGIDVSDDGRRFWAVSDSGLIAQGALLRSSGRLDAVRIDRLAPLRSPDHPTNLFKEEDAEGISVLPGGGFVVSYEGFHRVWRHASWDAPAEPILPARQFRRLRNNAGFEAVAVSPDGAILTLPEHPRGPPERYPVFRHAGDRWHRAPALARDPPWRAVGADFGPDGLFYLLERRFLGFGFASRIRRFDLSDPRRPIPGEELYRSLPGHHGNLEGIAIWRDDAERIRAVMVADDNFLRFQRSQVVEVILP